MRCAGDVFDSSALAFGATNGVRLCGGGEERGGGGKETGTTLHLFVILFPVQYMEKRFALETNIFGVLYTFR